MNQSTRHNPNSFVETFKDNLSIYSVFAFLWAMSMVWHYTRNPNLYNLDEPHLLVILSGFVVMLRPHRVWGLLVLSFSHILIILITPPFNSNHYTYQLFVNVALFSSYIYLIIKERRLVITSKEWFTVFRPVVALTLIFLYLFAVLHKLNAGFFSEASWAIRLYDKMLNAQHLGVLLEFLPRDQTFINIIPHLTLIIELLIPAGFLFKRTRIITIIFGFLFHVTLSIREFAPGTDFPTVVGAVYVLFYYNTSKDILDRPINKILNSQLFSIMYKFVLPFLLLCIIFIPSIVEALRLSHHTENTLESFTDADVKAVHWSIYIIIYVTIAVFVLFKTRLRIPKSEEFNILRNHPLSLAWLPLLFVFVSLSPYLGLRTANSFAMYSNLKVEGNYTNHFFIPVETQVFDYLKQVCVIETSSENIPITNETGKVLPYYEFLEFTQMAYNADKSIIYEFEGERVELERIDDAPDLIAPFTQLEQFYLRFASSRNADLDYCEHLKK